MWWNWQTRYFEVVVPKGVQVQVLPCAPNFLRKRTSLNIPPRFRTECDPSESQETFSKRI